MNEKKLKELLKILYTQELIGKNIYETLPQYPELNTECDKLIEVAYTYEVAVLNKKDYLTHKQTVIEKIMMIHSIASSIPTYRQSQIFFDDAGNFTGLF